MSNDRKKLQYWLMTGVIAAAMSTSFLANVQASQQSMSSVTEAAQIQPMNDGSGKYLMKSDGFYCLDVNGARSSISEVHYFDNFTIDGTVFDGYYYHDQDGKFKACTSHMEYLKEIPLFELAELEQNDTQDSQEETADTASAQKVDGFYFVNNLGRLSAAPQVRYIDHLTLNGTTFEGYYYFDENGKLVTDPQVHQVKMNCYVQNFDGSYYFGGANGALQQESTVTPEGFITDETGRVTNLDELGIENLKPQLEKLMEGYQGTWSVYVKDLGQDKEIVLNDQALYSASLIKAFVMEKTYQDLDAIIENKAKKLNTKDVQTARVKVDDLLYNMITVSDNESFNELVKLQTESLDFKKGAEAVNEYFEKQGYTQTKVQHTLHPAASAKESLGGRNMTSVRDCGMLLEKIYNKECVSEEASEKMLELLKAQQNTWKIPQGLPEGICSANKTGETDEDQHDMAIVYGEKTTYILCVMSEGCPEGTAITNIQNISKIVYNYLNL